MHTHARTRTHAKHTLTLKLAQTYKHTRTEREKHLLASIKNEVAYRSQMSVIERLSEKERLREGKREIEKETGENFFQSIQNSFKDLTFKHVFEQIFFSSP